MNIGCDIIAVARFQNWPDQKVQRIFDDQVYTQWIQRRRRPEYLASRWAIKEAIFKCCGILENVINDENGQPTSKNCSVSSTHDGGICWAIAVRAIVD